MLHRNLSQENHCVPGRPCQISPRLGGCNKWGLIKGFFVLFRRSRTTPGKSRTLQPKLHFLSERFLGVFNGPLTLIYFRDTNGRRIVIQLGGVLTTFCQEDGILLQKYRDRNGRCIAILFKSIGVRGRFDSLEEFPQNLKQITLSTSMSQPGR